MINSTLEQVKEFIIKEMQNSNFEINEDTSLQNDLKIFGDDASEILMKFCNKYKIDYKDFNFDDYFLPEPSWIDFLKPKRVFKSFTVKNLIKAIENKKLS